MQAILRGMGLSNEADVLQKFLDERVSVHVFVWLKCLHTRMYMIVYNVVLILI